jgi:hypothetical protein
LFHQSTAQISEFTHILLSFLAKLGKMPLLDIPLAYVFLGLNYLMKADAWTASLTLLPNLDHASALGWSDFDFFSHFEV